MTTVKENLIAAKALIETPEKYRGLKCAGGSPIQPATDAIDAVVPPFDGVEFGDCIAALKSAAGVAGISTLVAWSGGKTHADIMALFDRAIAAQGDTP